MDKTIILTLIIISLALLVSSVHAIISGIRHVKKRPSVMMTSSVTEVVTSRSRIHCVVTCAADAECAQSIYYEDSRICKKIPHMGINDPTDASIVDSEFQAAGGNEMFVPMFISHPSSCADVLAMDPAAESGIYFLWLTGTDQATRMWCDMEADGGGWTMVYSYKIEDPWKVVDPIPTWPAPEANLVPSTVPPSDLHRYGALDFPLWQALGTEFLMKSNHNNWVACTAGAGSLTEVRDGRVNCRLLRSVTTQCTDLNLNPTPDWHIEFVPRGVAVSTGLDWETRLYYYFDGDTRGNIPTHDPCGTDNYAYIFNKFIVGQIWLR